MPCRVDIENKVKAMWITFNVAESFNYIPHQTILYTKLFLKLPKYIRFYSGSVESFITYKPTIKFYLKLFKFIINCGLMEILKF